MRYIRGYNTEDNGICMLSSSRHHQIEGVLQFVRRLVGSCRDLLRLDPRLAGLFAEICFRMHCTARLAYIRRYLNDFDLVVADGYGITPSQALVDMLIQLNVGGTAFQSRSADGAHHRILQAMCEIFAEFLAR